MALQDDTAELIVAARDGDGAAWGRLVERYSGLLWSIARSYGLDDAESMDVVQTAWLRLVERIDGLDDPGAAGGWLTVTARRESLRLASRRGRELLGTVPDSPSEAPERVVIARERLGRVAAALHSLPRRCQALLRIFALAPSYAEAAAALEIPVGSVGPTRARCLESLRRRLAR
ncbi:RNA polymerase sigma factor [Spirillospora sp. CA-294931]|uniref:RNA polymerase sigma factor n=1 Tax=Spirillospora sp. CA-294931 TaxID=3240042 RepID=UPI003D8E9C03